MDPVSRFESARGATAGVVAGAAAGGLATWVGMHEPDYGLVLFGLVPLLVGLVCAVVSRWGGARPLGAVIGLSSLSMGLYTLGLMVGAIEGILCILMAVPIAYPFAVVGTMIGHSLAHRPTQDRNLPPLLIFFAGLLGALGWDLWMARAPATAEVRSYVDVEAAPTTVWREVLALSELPPPKDWVLRTGLACPVRTELRGQGVGAIRHCTLTTGAMPERVSAWEPERRLGWVALATPPPLKEVNPFRETNPPHLHGFYQVHYGEFELIPLSPKRTRLVRLTRYEHRIRPAFYWTRWCDFGVERVHRYVLEHVRDQAERAARTNHVVRGEG